MRSFIIALGFGALPVMTSAAEDHQCFAVSPNREPAVSEQACTDFLDTGTDNAMLLSEAYANRGIARRELGALAESAADLKAALKLSQDTNHQRMLAWTYREMNRPAEAEEIYTRVLANDDHWQGWLSRCVVRQDQQKYEQAAEDCEKAVTRDPGNLDALYFAARAYNFLGDGPRAHPLASTGVSLAPDDVRHLVELVWATYLSGDARLSIDLAKDGLQKFPGNLELMSFLDEAR